MLTSQWIYKSEDGWFKSSGSDIEDPHLILIFGTGSYFVESSYDDLRKMFPNSDIVGCSTAGTVAGNVVDDVTVATMVRLDKGSVKVVSQNVQNIDDSASAGEKMARELDQEKLQHVFVLSDGLTINGGELTSGFNNVFTGKVQVTGGLAGDGMDFKHTYVISNESARERAVTAVGFYGDSLEVTSGCFAGWDEFGAERVITKSRGNILYEIDGKPALQLYKSYLLDEAEKLPASGLKFPISIRKNQFEEPIIRTLLGIDEEEQSLIFAGDVKEGDHCRLMKSNIDKLIYHAGLAAEHAKKSEQPDLCILVSCVGRRIVLSQLVEEELDTIEEVLGKGTLLSGFYSYGEIAPLVGLQKCDLHNQTMTLTVINEKES